MPPKSAGTTELPRTDSLSVVLIDDHPLLHEGILALLRRQPDLRVIGAAADTAIAARTAGRVHADVVLLDVGLGEARCLDLIAALHGGRRPVRILLLGLTPEHDGIADFVRAGVAGFVLKEATSEELGAAIRAVARGTLLLPAALTGALFSRIARDPMLHHETNGRETARLTPREREIVTLLGAGCSNKQIADRLHIAVHTVKSHVHNVLGKLSLRSRLEVAAFSHGWSSAHDDGTAPTQI